MLIPESLVIGPYHIPTLYIFVVVGLFYSLFATWYESRKDGFDTERIFDMTFISGGLSLLFGILLRYRISYLEIYDPLNPLLRLDAELLTLFLPLFLFIGAMYLFARKFKWSVYRILDIQTIFINCLLIFLTLGRYLLSGQPEYIYLTLIGMALQLIVFKFRSYKISSGLSFTIFTLVLSSYGFIVFRKSGYLLFYPLLVTIGLVNFYFRKRNTMQGDMLKFFKGKLLNKDKDLKEQEKLLRKEDPYMQEGRTEDNSDPMDEAVLEDQQKEINDMSKNFVAGMRMQVRKALAAIKIGKYGICEVCGKPIDKARLQAYPEATTCMECAEKLAKQASVAGE